jgi:hypothetical protein
MFGEAEYAPGTERGNHVMAHELAHTIQRTPSGPARVRRLTPASGTTTSAASAEITSFEMTPGMDATETSPAGNPAGFNEGAEFLLRLDSSVNPADYAIVQAGSRIDVPPRYLGWPALSVRHTALRGPRAKSEADASSRARPVENGRNSYELAAAGISYLANACRKRTGILA